MSDDFIKSIQGAKEIPGDAYEFEMPRLFGGQSEHVSKDKLDDGGGLVLEYTCHTRVFTIWRPWTDCVRCQSDAASDLAAARDGGTEYECPHVQKEEYTETMNSCMANGYVINHKDYFSLGDGSRCVQVEWLIPKPRKKNPMEPTPLSELEEEEVLGIQKDA